MKQNVAYEDGAYNSELGEIMADGELQLSPDLRRARGIALLLEQTSRLYYDKHPENLHSVQWAALRYFNRAGQRSRNVAGLAKFLGVTSAPASRTAASLVNRKLTSVEPCPDDSRCKVFSLTQKGKDSLADDPINRVAEIIAHLDEKQKTLLATTLDKIYNSLNIE
ncbi:MAG: MarR family winged helix-turn-helix transcriptional regulator [bacterium]